MNDSGYSPIFYFDRIKVGFYIDAEEVESYFGDADLYELTQQSRSFALCNRKKVNKWDFSSELDIVAPSPTALRILSELGRSIGKAYHFAYSEYATAIYKICYVEIAKDIPFDTRHEAIEATDDKCRQINLRWMGTKSKTIPFDVDEFERMYKKDAGYIIGSTTFYCGGESMCFAGYARTSKVTGKICSHTEFRIVKKAAVKKHTEIEVLQDLFEFDFMGFFDRVQYKYVYEAEIDEIRLGKWILGWDSLKRISEAMNRRALRQARYFCRLHHIWSYADLQGYLVRKKAAVRDQYKGCRGRKRKLDQKYLDVKPSRFRTEPSDG